MSDKKSRQVVRQARKRAPEALIALCGCYPQTHPEDMEGLPVDLVAGTGDRLGFVELVERTYGERRPVTALDEAVQTASTRSIRELPSRNSRPQEDISIPVSTSSW